MFYCCSLDEFFEDFKALLDDKAPGPKINVFVLIEAYLEENNKEKLIK
jgi:cytoskeleton-associated protein 5